MLLDKNGGIPFLANLAPFLPPSPLSPLHWRHGLHASPLLLSWSESKHSQIKYFSQEFSQQQNKSTTQRMTVKVAAWIPGILTVAEKYEEWRAPKLERNAHRSKKFSSGRCFVSFSSSLEVVLVSCRLKQKLTPVIFWPCLSLYMYATS